MWFPEGYWAEREYRPLETPRRRSYDMRMWKRGKRSQKSHSGSSHEVDGDLASSHHTTANCQHGSPYYAPRGPFRSEEALVQSLQHPPEPMVDITEHNSEHGTHPDEEMHEHLQRRRFSDNSPTEQRRQQTIRYLSAPWNCLGLPLLGAKVCDAFALESGS